MNGVERRIKQGKYVIEWPSGGVSEGFRTEGEARRMMEAIRGPAVIKRLVRGGPPEYVGTEGQPEGTDLARLVRLDRRVLPERQEQQDRRGRKA